MGGEQVNSYLSDFDWFKQLFENGWDYYYYRKSINLDCDCYALCTRTYTRNKHKNQKNIK